MQTLKSKCLVVLGVIFCTFVFVQFGLAVETNGNLASTLEINDSTSNGAALSDGDDYGFAIADIGDLNNDGVNDIAVGANKDDAGGSDKGAVHIHFMNTDGSIDSTVELNDNSTSGPTLADGDGYGSYIEGLGDLNGDGIEDIAVGAPFDDDGGTNRGAVHIHFMKANGDVNSTVEINDSTANGPVLGNNDTYGWGLANIGDLNDDGVNDLAVGARFDDAGAVGGNRGATHIHFMNTNGSLDSTVEINYNTANGPALINTDGYGSSVEGLGDLNGDGVEDIAVGATHNAGTSSFLDDEGAIFISFLNTNGSVASTIEINEGVSNGPTLNDDDAFGMSVASIGDINDDGVIDLAVGAPDDDGAGTTIGAVHILFLNTSGGLARSTVEINASTTNGPTLSDSDSYGRGVEGIDLDGDGLSEVIGGAIDDDNGGTDRGAIHLHEFTPLNSIAGTVYSDAGVTTLGNGSTVRLLLDGVSVGTDTLDSGNGTFLIEDVDLTAGSVLTAYIDDSTPNGVTVTLDNNENITGLNIYQDHLITRSESASALTNTHLGTANDSDPGASSTDISSIYTDSGGAVTVTSGTTLLVFTGDTYQPGGTINANGPITISGTLNASTGSINVAGHFTNNGTFTHTGTLTFNGSTAQNFAQGSTSIGSDVAITNTSGAVTVTTNNFNIGANDLSIASSAKLNINGLNITSSGTFTNSGTLQLKGSETISITQDIDSGTWEYLGDGTGAATTHTIKDFGSGADYYHLTINDASASNSDTFQAGSGLRVDGNTTITDGTFSGSNQSLDFNGNLSIGATGAFTATSGTTTLFGNFTKTGTFTHNSGTLTLDGTNQSISGSSTFNNLTKIVASAATLTLAEGATQTITGALTLNGASGQVLSLRSTTDSVVTSINPQGSRDLQYLNVKDNVNTNILVASCIIGCVDAGNNTNWVIMGAVDGVTITESGGTTEVTEGGVTDSYTVVLDNLPTASVTITLSPDAQSSVDDNELVFTTLNWAIPQTVTVSAVNDSVDETTTHASTITHSASSGDAGYNGVSIDSVSITVTDNDTAGITVSTISGNTTEAGGTATFTIVLDSQPTANVSVGLTSSDTTEGTISASSVTFTDQNWNTPQVITMTGVNDDVDDGNIVYSAVTAAASSVDASYNTINAGDVSVTNTDNDTAGITVSTISGNTTEAGGTATFTIVLDSQPTANVSVGLTSSDTTEGTISASSVTFTDQNWSTPQTLTMTGVNDDVDDGDIAYTAVLAAASSVDGTYNGINPSDVAVTNTDNDEGGDSGGSSGGSGGGGGSRKNDDDQIDDEQIIDEGENDEPEINIDLPDHWSQGYIKNLTEQRRILDLAVNVPSFMQILTHLLLNPNQENTREEALELLMVTAGYETTIITINERDHLFTDVPLNSQRAGLIQYAHNLKLIDGYPDGSFRPNQVINRAEAVKMSAKFFNIEVPNLRGNDLLAYFELQSNPFKDLDIEAWYAPYVLKAYTSGVVSGYGNGDFGPGNPVTYAEFLKISTLMSQIDIAVQLASELEADLEVSP